MKKEEKISSGKQYNQQLLISGKTAESGNFFTKSKREAFVPDAVKALVNATTKEEVIQAFRSINKQDFMHDGALQGRGIREENAKHRIEGSEIVSHYGSTTAIMNRLGNYAAAKLEYLKNPKSIRNLEILSQSFKKLIIKLTKDYSKNIDFKGLSKELDSMNKDIKNTHEKSKMKKIHHHQELVAQLSGELVQAVNHAWGVHYGSFEQLRHDIEGMHSLRHLLMLCDFVGKLSVMPPEKIDPKKDTAVALGWSEKVRAVMPYSPDPWAAPKPSASSASLFGAKRDSDSSSDVSSVSSISLR